LLNCGVSLVVIKKKVKNYVAVIIRNTDWLHI